MRPRASGARRIRRTTAEGADHAGRPRLRSLIVTSVRWARPMRTASAWSWGFSGARRRSFRPVRAAGRHTWHFWPDGGATIATADGGWIYVSNSEPPSRAALAPRFDAEGQIIDAYPHPRWNKHQLCGRTDTVGNLALLRRSRGMSRVRDRAWGEVDAVERPALGRFKHEAVTIDPELGCVYLSEDESDGCFYRFVSSISMRTATSVSPRANFRSPWWTTLAVSPGFPSPTRSSSETSPTRQQVSEATVFDGGEGIWWFEGTVYLSTKGDNRVWAYDTQAQTIRTIYDRAATGDPDALYGVDNFDRLGLRGRAGRRRRWTDAHHGLRQWES